MDGTDEFAPNDMGAASVAPTQPAGVATTRMAPTALDFLATFEAHRVIKS